MSAPTTDERAILEYLTNVAATGETGMVSLRGMSANGIGAAAAHWA